MALDDTKTLAERILRLEQKLQRLEKREGRPPVELFDNSAIRNRKIIDDLLVHNHTHANLLGLDADDHTQYLNTTRHDTTTRHTLGTVVPHDDHGSLSGLDDDDHTQYTKHPASSTDNAIARWDGTDGDKLQNSVIKIDDNGKFSGDALDGWIYDTDTWTYVSATSFKIAGKNVAYRFPKGTKIKLVQTTTKYFYVVATAFSTDTTVTITGGSDYTLAEAAISGQAYSYAAAPQGYPFGTVAIRVERSTNQSIPNGTWTALSFDTIITEEKPATTSQWSSGDPTQLICRLPGYYLINAHVRLAANATGGRGINLVKNGSTALVGNVYAAFSGIDAHIQCSAIVKLDTGDYIEAKAYQNSGAALDAVAISSNLHFEWIRLGI